MCTTDIVRYVYCTDRGIDGQKDRDIDKQIHTALQR